MSTLSVRLVKRHHFFLPQCRYLCIDGISVVDRVGRFENLDDDFERIRADMNLQGCALQRLNASNSSSNFLDSYSQQMRDRISELYQEDIVRYRYAFK